MSQRFVLLKHLEVRLWRFWNSVNIQSFGRSVLLKGKDIALRFVNFIDMLPFSGFLKVKMN